MTKPATNSGPKPTDSEITARNRALCAGWLDWLSKRNKPLTCYQYAVVLEKLCAHAGERPFGRLAVQDIEAFIDRQRRYGVMPSAGTRARDLAVVRSLYQWANSHGHVSVNPAADLRPVTVRNHNPRAIPDELWSKVWRSELDDPMRAILGLGFYVGLRREEICRLKAEHFVGERILHFPRKGDRNDKVSGVVPWVSCARLYAQKRPDLLSMPEDFLLAIQRLLQRSEDGWVIPWGSEARPHLRSARPGPPVGMTNPDQINKRLGMLLLRLGLARASFTPHALRHSFVTNMLTMGVPLTDVSVLANHSSIAITTRYVKTASDPLARFLDVSLRDVVRWGDQQ